jgi:ribonuclease J
MSVKVLAINGSPRPNCNTATLLNYALEGATAYILHTTAGPVVYTGDFRFHGYKGDETRRFVERAAAVEPVAMICEGTRVNSTQVDSEEQAEAARALI